MTKTIELDGVKHEFPDDFSNEEIKAALTSHEPAKPSAGPMDYVSKAIEPITSYPATYSKMNQEARDQMSQGAQQLSHPGGAMDIARGLGNLALGGIGYVGSPVNAAIDTVAGKPIEENTGLPAKYTDFAVSMALPVPKSIPRIGGAAAKTAEKAPSVEQLDAAAKAGFQHPEVATLSIRPKALQTWSDVLKSKLTDSGFDENIAPKTWAILKRVENAPPGSAVTGKNLQSLRQTFQRAAGTADSQEVAAATRAIESLDKFVEGGVNPDMLLRGDPSLVASIWSNARGNYAAARRSERITGAVERAELNASSAGSGANIDNATRQQLKSILKNQKARRGFSGEELRTMQQIVKGSYTGDAARAIGNMLGGGGGLGTITAAAAGAGAGAATHGPIGGVIGAALPVVGFVAKKIGNAITSANVEKLDELVRSRSPLATQMIKPMIKFNEAADAYQVSKAPRNLARLTLASRNLATNLKDAGITTTAENLMQSLQGPQQAGAQNEKP